MSPPVVVLGDVLTDVVVRPLRAVVPDSDTPSQIRTGPGGAGANVAVGLAAAGVEVRLLGRVGRDDAGRAHRATLTALGVTVDLVEDPERPTGTVVVVLGEDGRRTMYPDRGANAVLSGADVGGKWPVAGGHLHLSGYPLLDPGSRPAALHALDRARSAGMTVSIDPSSVGPLQQAGVDRFLAWTAGVDLCLPNRAEAELLLGTDVPGAGAAAADSGDPVTTVAEALARRYGEVVVTAGPDGAAWSDGTAVLRRAALQATVRDTTGAGDAFTAGFLAAWTGAGAANRSAAQRLAVARAALTRALERAAGAVAVVGAGPAGRPPRH